MRIQPDEEETNRRARDPEVYDAERLVASRLQDLVEALDEYANLLGQCTRSYGRQERGGSVPSPATLPLHRDLIRITLDRFVKAGDVAERILADRLGDR